MDLVYPDRSMHQSAAFRDFSFSASLCAQAQVVFRDWPALQEAMKAGQELEVSLLLAVYIDQLKLTHRELLQAVLVPRGLRDLVAMAETAQMRTTAAEALRLAARQEFHSWYLARSQADATVG